MQGVVVVDRRLEDGVVGPEGDGGAGGLGLAQLLELLGDLAARKLHLVDAAVALDLDHHLLGEGVDDRGAHAVQAAGDLVGLVVELSAGVQDGEDDLEGRDLLLGVLGHGDASAVVLDGHGVVRVDRHLNLGAEARHGLVDGVVDNLPHQVVQAGRRSGTNVHARTLAHGLKALEDLNFARIVRVVVLLCHVTPLRAQQDTESSVLHGHFPSRHARIWWV